MAEAIHHGGQAFGVVHPTNCRTGLRLSSLSLWERAGERE
jgi:hypothetical protein